MSNITTFNPNKVPSFVKKAELSAIAKALAGSTGGVSMKRISTKGGVFRLLSGGKEIASIDDRHLDVVIVNAAPKVSRTFYAGQYVEGETKAPDCWSADGEVPDPTARDKQANSCKDCPQNIQGSGVGNSRACRFQQRIAVLLGKDLDGEVYQLTLPGKSIFGEGEHNKWPLEAYGKFIGSKGFPITSIVTEARFDTTQATPVITFKPVRFLDKYKDYV